MTCPVERDSLLSAEDNRRMFDRIARRYDRMNCLLSLGLDRRWRRKAVGLLAPAADGRYLDIGCGTGDVAIEILRQCESAQVVGIDPAEAMLAIAAGKTERATFQIGDATDLAFEDESFAGIISAFCLRNIARRARAFEEMRRTLVPGGRAVILELTVPRSRLLRFGHHLYLRGVVLPVGWLIARSADAYRFLADSIAEFAEPGKVGHMMNEAGFVDTQQVAILGGTVTIFVGRTPEAQG